MRLRQIEIFYHVYRAGSISGAARALNVSQPSVSKVLRHAEDQLGFELFRRNKGRLVATARAHELFREAKDLYRRLESFNRTLENMRGRQGGHLRLGVLPSLSLSVGPELAARLSAGDDGLSVELTTLHSDEISASLIESRTDLCIGFEPVAHDRVEAHAVGGGGFALVSKEALVPLDNAVNLSRLDEAKFIGLQERGPLAKMVSEALAERGIEPEEVITTHTYHVALSMVRKGAGLTITDQFTAYSSLGTGLHRYPLGDLPQFSVYAVHRSDHPDRDMVDHAVTALKQVLVELGKGIAAIQSATS